MDSSPDLSVKLRRGSSDSRDSFYMGFAQGIDSDIEEVTTVQSVPPPPLYPAPEEPPIEIPACVEPEELEGLPEEQVESEQTATEEDVEEVPSEPEVASPSDVPLIEASQVFFDQIPPPPLLDEDDDEMTNTSVTVIQTPSKNKSPSSSSSSISSGMNELAADDSCQSLPPPPVDSPKAQLSHVQSVEAEIASTPTPPHHKSPPSQKSHSSHRSPPKKLDLPRESRVRNFDIDSDSIDSINAIDCKIDDDNRDDSSPTDSMPPAPTPPPLHFPLSLEKSGIMEANAQALVPSPSSPDNAIVSPESLSHHSSPAKSSRVLHYAQHVTTIDETRMSPSSLRSSHHQLIQSSRRSTPSSPPPPFQSGPLTPALSVLSNNSLNRVDSSQAMVPHHSAFRIDSQTTKSPSSPEGGGGGGGTTTQHLAVLYQTHHHLHPILTSPARRQSRLPDTSRFLHQQSLGYSSPKEIKASDAFCSTLSALYGKILVVMGIAFPMAEVISTYIPPSFYEGFYLYLYIGSMIFLLFMYATLIWGSNTAVTTQAALKSAPPARHPKTSSSSDSGDDSDHEESESSASARKPSSRTIVAMRRPSIMAAAALKSQHYGSFYLRMGAVAFGIGSMIYSGLEFGQYFELERDTKCHNVLLALTPATRMAFIFIQMYFIFLNNEQIKVYRHKILARFGLMHMIGTNLSVWFSVLIQETKHEILTFYDPENRTLKISHRLGHAGSKVVVTALEEAHSRVARGLKGPHNIFECRRSNILGTLVQDASPFLFPCTIEYSLICAAILYVMWRNISRPTQEPNEIVRAAELHPYKRSPHHYSVDCAGAHKGLFIGILMLVLTIISLILFFVLISKPEFTQFAVTEVNICELTLYGTTTIATLVGMVQVRTLHYDSTRSFSLDDILLVGGQTGSFLYSTFTIIGAHLTLQKNTILILITAMASLVETAFQTMFILDASRRSAATPDHIRKKPGRELVTFLLVSNLAMWAINTLEKSRAESHPLQLHFYGLWAWTIITHVSMPLAIFYRFHSTVCLCDIWKRAWKMKPAYM